MIDTELGLSSLCDKLRAMVDGFENIDSEVFDYNDGLVSLRYLVFHPGSESSILDNALNDAERALLFRIILNIQLYWY